MNLFNALRGSEFFTGRTGIIAVGVLLLLALYAGTRKRAGGRGTGKFARPTEIILRYGDFASFPLSLFAVSVLYAFLMAIAGVLLYLGEGALGFNSVRRVMAIGAPLLFLSILLYLLWRSWILESRGNRYPFGRIRYLGFYVLLWLPEKDRFEHVKIQGRAGTGKTTGFMFPGVLQDAEGNCSVVALDVKSPQAFETVAGAWCAKGKKVILFDPYHPECIGFEPLATATLQTLSRIEEAVYGKRDTSAEDQTIFFDDQERRLFRLCCRLVKAYKDPRQCNLPMVHQLALRGVPALESAVTYCRDAGLQREFNTFFENRQQVHNLLGGMLNKLDLFSDPKVAAAFSRPDLDLSILFQEPSLLIVASPQKDPKARLGAALLLRALMLKIYEKPERESGQGLPIFIYLDEFYNLFLPEMPDFVNTARSTRTGVTTFMQTQEQLYQYKRHEVGSLSINQKLQIYLKGCDITLCKDLSDRLGKRLLKERRVSRSWLRPSQTTTVHVEAPLLTPDQIENLDHDQALCFTGDMRGFLIERISSLTTALFRKKARLPAKAYRPNPEPLVAPSYKDFSDPMGSEGSPHVPPPPSGPIEMIGY